MHKLKRAHNNLPPAAINPYRPCNNLSAAAEPYGTYDNLCLTIMNPYRACNNLSAITDPIDLLKSLPEPIMIVARLLRTPTEPIVIVRTTTDPYRARNNLRSGYYRAKRKIKLYK